MKNQIVFIIILFFLLPSCTFHYSNRNSSSSRPDINTDRIPYYLKLNSSLYHEFGLPVESDNSGYWLCIENKKTVTDSLMLGVITFSKSDSIIHFEYNNHEVKVKGAFRTHDVFEVHYQRSIDIETGLVSEVTPLYFIQPFRFGVWEYTKNGRTELINFDININTSKLGQFCK